MHDRWLETEFASLYLEELLKESILASGRTAPNPTVAALAFDSTRPEDRTSGATEPPGKRHAEIVALDRFQSQFGRSPDSLIVTLEPCSKTGRTAPCVDRIRSIPELQQIYIGCLDPALSGEGVRLLQHSGRSVYLPRTWPVSQGSSSLAYPSVSSNRIQHRPAGLESFLSGLGRLYGLFPASFAHRLLYGRPRMILKAASDPTGCMGDSSRRVMVSGRGALQAGQLLRRVVDAIIVGPRTVLVDEPSLDWRADPRGIELGPSSFDTESTVDTPQKMVDSRSIYDASNQRSFHYLKSPDPFIEALLRYGSESQMYKPEFDHQPVRIFLMPESGRSLERFHEAQKQIELSGGPEPIFWTLSKKKTPGDLPSMKDPLFGSALLRNLSELGFNTVLVEGGAGLHSSLRSILQPDDRFYWLRRKEPLDVSDFEQPVMLPAYLKALPELQSIDLGLDELVAFAGRS